MNKLLAQLPAFALPFVTRSLRGGRAKRYLSFSVLLTALTVLLGLWIALGNGRFEQNIRTELGLEEFEWHRGTREFTVYVHDDRSLKAAEQELADYRRRGAYGVVDTSYGEVTNLVVNGRRLVYDAAWSSIPWDETHQALQARARALYGGTPGSDNDYAGFAWHDPAAVEQLERVLDRQGIPEVRRYESPLGLVDALQLIGLFAGLILAACLTVFGPLFVAVQQAQERHENTLMPLMGTSLSPRELALGLAAGPTTVLAIFAVPQLVLFGLCALLAGHFVVALVLIVALATSSLFLTFAAQLFGQLIGARRTPGIIGIVLMSLLGMAWLLGGALIFDVPRELHGIGAVLPTFGLSALLAETFSGALNLPVARVLTSTLAWTGAAVVFAWLALTALSRKFEDREAPLLGADAAFVGALTCVALVHVALPTHRYSDAAEVRMYLGLAMLALPLAVLLMGRVPLGDMAPRLRRVPVARLLGEFVGWGAVHVVLTVLLFRRSADLDMLHPVALLWLGWCVAVLGLIAIRMVAVPATLLTHVWTGFCALTLVVGFVQAIVWVDGPQSLGHVFALSELSPVLGLLQVIVTIAVPVTLVRHLRKSLGSIASNPAKTG
jgi:hypothetical protein